MRYLDKSDGKHVSIVDSRTPVTWLGPPPGGSFSALARQDAPWGGQTLELSRRHDGRCVMPICRRHKRDEEWWLYVVDVYLFLSDL